MTPDEARGIAKVLYRDRLDSNWIPEIEHVLKVARRAYGNFSVDDRNSRFETRMFQSTMVVAYLHDVVEDRLCSLAELQDWGLTDPALEALRLITRWGEGSHSVYIDHIAQASGDAGRIARVVKIADLRENIQREPALDGDIVEQRYLPALSKLMEAEGVAA